MCACVCGVCVRGVCVCVCACVCACVRACVRVCVRNRERNYLQAAKAEALTCHAEKTALGALVLRAGVEAPQV